MGLGMRRYSAVWWVCVLLKLLAVLTLASPVLNLFSLQFDGNPALVSGTRLLGMNIEFTNDQFKVLNALRTIFAAAAFTLLYWAAAEALRMIANTEVYTRGTYSVFRKRAEQQQRLTSQAARIRSQTPIIPDSEIVPFEAPPPDPRKRKRLGESSGYRDTNTVFVRAAKVHERPENAVRPPRPAGEIEVIQDLNETPRGEDRGLPFDRV